MAAPDEVSDLVRKDVSGLDETQIEAISKAVETVNVAKFKEFLHEMQSQETENYLTPIWQRHIDVAQG